jgi:hypothetical protein
MSAASPAGARFAHRSNRNGTTDLICRHCFTTVTTAIWEAELDRAERAHACEAWMLQRLAPSVRENPATFAPGGVIA